MLKFFCAAVFVVFTQIPFANAQQLQTASTTPYQLTQTYACGKTCGRVRSCREAVYQWCVCGYSRADGDRDGVPCEKVCGQSTRSNLEKVRGFRRELGCR